MGNVAVSSIEIENVPSTVSFDWRRLLLLGCVAAMEILWLGTLIYVFLSYTINPFSVSLLEWYIPIGASFCLAIGVRRVLLVRKTPRREQLIALWGVYAISMVFTIFVLSSLEGYRFDLEAAFDISQPVLPNGVILLPIIGLTVIRGVATGRISLTPESVRIRLSFGVMMFFIAVVLSLFIRHSYQDQFSREILLIIPMFFVASLFASALARSSSLRMPSDSSKQLFGLSWMGFLTLMTLALTSISSGLAILMMAIDRDDVVAVLKAPLAFFVGLIFVLAAPFLYLAETIFSEMKIQDSPEQVVITTGESAPPRTSSDAPQIDIGDFIRDAAQFFTHGFGIVCIGVFVFVFLFWVFLFLIQDDNNFLKKRDGNEDGAREGAGKARGAFNNRFKKIADLFGLTDRFGFMQQLFGALTIRWIYSRMERLATKQGFPRPNSQTPNEYRQLLNRAFPDGDEEIRLITNAYVAIRYGELPEDGQKLNDVRAAFDRLKEIVAY